MTGAPDEEGGESRACPRARAWIETSTSPARFGSSTVARALGPARGLKRTPEPPSGQVVLMAPTATTVERLDRVLRQKARWTVERARRGRRLPRPAPQELVSGETVLYLGRSYRLRVVEAPSGAPARLERG